MNWINIISQLLAIISISNIFAIGFRGLYSLYPFGLILALIAFIISGRKKIDLLLALFAFACLLSILVNNIPAYFRVWDRYLFFLVSLMFLSPFIQSEQLNKVRGHIYKATNRYLLLIVFLSFIANVTGISSGQGQGGYHGLFRQSMIMGPVASLTFLLAFHQWYHTEELKKNAKRYYLALTPISFIFVVMSGSRIALAGAIFGFFLMLFKLYQSNLKKYSKKILILFFAAIIVLPVAFNYSEIISEKINYSKEQGSTTATRDYLWQSRLKEFSESPLAGIGFSAARYGKIDSVSGNVEPGTSWGVILSMTGIFGMIPFVIFIGKIFIDLIRTNYYYTPLFLGIIGFFVIHWTAEGYILASGSFFFYYFWLAIGVIKQYTQGNEVSIL